ncbi:MAG: peptidylprolyl isomerase [Proteobacteria bacterium]|nr:peptidylprolyl isomerase [Pseudomonadota bacterium]MBU4034983.1 peptidylprolyl isomerase [Pseudomonadota bacterium]
MEKVENNMYVSVHYKGTLNNGEVFDSSEGRMPLEILMGGGQLIKGFEDSLAGMALKEKKTFTLAPEDAYGQREENLLHHFPLSEVPPGVIPEVGQLIGLQMPDGRQVPAQVVQIDNENVTLDLNHPLAGQALTFDIEVVGISNTPTQIQPDSGCGCGCSSSGNCNDGGDCGEGCC